MVASQGIESKERLGATGFSKAVNASEEFLGQRDDDARRASHVAESVLVLGTGPPRRRVRRRWRAGERQCRRRFRL